MFNYVDLALLALILFFVVNGIRKGFARSLLSFVGRIASLVVAYFVSDMYADVVYEKFFKETLMNTIESNFGSVLPENAAEQIYISWSNLPQSLLNIGDKLALDMLAIHGEIEDIDVTQEVSSALESSIAGPVATAICQIIIFAIVSAIASFVFSIAVNFLCKIVKLPIIKTADKLLGAGLGLINGAISVFIISFVCIIVSGLVDSTEFSELIDSSYIIDFFAYANMLV